MNYICSFQEERRFCSTAGSTRAFFCGINKIQSQLKLQNSLLQHLPIRGGVQKQRGLGRSRSRLRFSPPRAWHGCWPSHSPSETFRHRSLTPAGRLGGFSQVFLTRPVPESHLAEGRLQPFVTWPVGAWLRMTGDGCVKQLSDPIQKRGRMTEGKVPSRECALFFFYGRHLCKLYTVTGCSGVRF